MNFITILLAILLAATPAYSVTRIYDRATGDIIDADKDDAEFDNTNNAINTHTADTSAHDATGGVVGVSKTQTLTNKTLTSPIITNAPTAAGSTWTDLGHVTTFTATSGTVTTFNVSTSGLNLLNSADLNIYSDAVTTLQGSIDGATGEAILSHRAEGIAINCEVNVSGSTATFSGKDGVALSATNPCLIGVRSNTNGIVVSARFTANVAVTFGATSLTDSNLFGITDADWASAMPMFVGVVYNGTTPYFTLSRIPALTTGSAASDICQLSEESCDAQSDVMILTTGLTLASWVDLPITPVAWLQGTYATAGGAWTFSETPYTGFNKLWLSRKFSMPFAQMGSAAGTFLVDNGGAAPLFSDNEYTYFWTSLNNVCTNIYLNGDPGTDGSGAVASQVATPYIFPSGTMTTIYPGTGRVNGATTITGAQAISGRISENTSLFELYYLDANAAVTQVSNSFFSNGARYILTGYCYTPVTN